MEQLDLGERAHRRSLLPPIAAPVVLGCVLLTIQLLTLPQQVATRELAPQITVVILITAVMAAIGVANRRRVRAYQRNLTAEIELRKSSERELAQREAFLTALLEAMDVEVVAVDADGSAVLWNEAARASHDLREPLPDSHVEDWSEQFAVRYPDGVPVPTDLLPISRALRGERVVGEEYLMAAGGVEQHLWVNARPIVLEDGSSAGALCTGANITKLHQRELELARLNADLDAIAKVTGHVLSGHDARQAIVDAACEVSGALTAMLFEPDPSDPSVLVAVAQAGGIVPGFTIRDDGSTRTSAAYRTGKTQLTSDVAHDPGSNTGALRTLSTHLDQEKTIRASVTVPVKEGDRVRAVLSLALAQPMATGDLRLIGLLELLAADASLALGREDTSRKLAALATTDPLTGLDNRRRWDERLEDEETRARRTGQPFCVAVLDLDHFKAYNDSRGHTAGDELLAALALAWRGCLRESDVLARLGGEEFGVLLPGCAEAHAVRVLEKLLAAVPHGQTSSAGVAQWAGERVAATVERADLALYAAKHAGRARLMCAPQFSDAQAVVPAQVSEPGLALSG